MGTDVDGGVSRLQHSGAFVTYASWFEYVYEALGMEARYGTSAAVPVYEE